MSEPAGRASPLPGGVRGDPPDDADGAVKPTGRGLSWMAYGYTGDIREEAQEKSA